MRPPSMVFLPLISSFFSLEYGALVRPFRALTDFVDSAPLLLLQDMQAG